MSPTTTTKIMSTRSRIALTSEAVLEIGESALMLSEALKKYKRRRREADEEDDEVSGEEEEQPTSPPAGEASNVENITAIQIWDEFMGEKVNELPDTEYIKNVSLLVGSGAADALAARAGLQLITDRENFVKDPEKCKSELRRKIIKLLTHALIGEAESTLTSCRHVAMGKIKKIEEVEIKASSMKKDVKKQELTTSKKIAEANKVSNEFLVILTDD